MVEWTTGPEEGFEFAAERGFDFVELNMGYTFERTRIDPARVRRLADEYGLDVVVHLPYALDPGSPHEHVRDGACRELEASIDAAAEFGAEKGIFHATSWARPEKWDREEIRGYIYDSVRRVDAHARERGIEACVENLKTPFFDAGDFPDLFDRTDAAACLDTGHAHVTGQGAAAWDDLLRGYPGRVSHVHLNDTRRDDDDEHLPVGLGKLDFGALAAAMREADWAGTCTHEVFTYDPGYAARGKETFDRLLE